MTATNGSSRKVGILHVVEYQKFISPFIALVNKYFDTSRHHFFFIRNGRLYIPQGDEVVTRNADTNRPFSKTFSFIRKANRADKIVLHGLFSSWLILVLFFQPWLLRRCYWIIWGGDLYNYTSGVREGFDWIKEVFRRPIIKNFGHLVTYVKGDVKLARHWYGAKGDWHDCLIYPSNLYQELQTPIVSHDGVNILLGNSADPSNNHREILDRLRQYVKNDTLIYCPLSYGPQSYAKEISDYGKLLYGNRFIALLDFMKLEEYKILLASIDIAIFNHKRQQAMGNIITLLGMGKTVFIRSDITSWQTLAEMGLVVGDYLRFDLRPFRPSIADENKMIISKRFNENVLINQLRHIFEN